VRADGGALVAWVVDADDDVGHEGEGGTVELDTVLGVDREATAVPERLTRLLLKCGKVGRNGERREGVSEGEHRGKVREANGTEVAALLLGRNSTGMVADRIEEVVVERLLGPARHHQQLPAPEVLLALSDREA
jgi:hypothetical protein